MERPTQPDQISGRGRGMLFRVGMKLDLHFYTFRIRSFLLLICSLEVFSF